MAVLSKFFVAGVSAMAAVQGANAGVVPNSAKTPFTHTIFVDVSRPTPTNSAAGCPPPRLIPLPIPVGPDGSLPKLSPANSPLPASWLDKPLPEASSLIESMLGPTRIVSRGAPLPRITNFPPIGLPLPSTTPSYASAHYITLVGGKDVVHAMVPAFAVRKGIADTYIAVPAGFELKRKDPAMPKPNPGNVVPPFNGPSGVFFPDHSQTNSTAVEKSTATVEKSTATVTGATSTTTEPGYTTAEANTTATGATSKTATEPAYTTVGVTPSATVSGVLEARKMVPKIPTTKEKWDAATTDPRYCKLWWEQEFREVPEGKCP